MNASKNVAGATFLGGVYRNPALGAVYVVFWCPQRDLRGFAKTPSPHGESPSEGWWRPHEPITYRIERMTCGLRISDSPTSDNLTPQETTNQDAPDMGEDGAGLSCPGSSVVADADDESRK